MPLALLLSPDDQAVSAITSVLEEMSVTCERPLDGVTAAQKLNSQGFDLVLVDCENLPAAKLIFDVCRRGKGGNNPVPIAIVDGRAGLPTAFRLGAELILTKPVAKDQARNTIRTAVGRVKKEEPAHGAQPMNAMQAEAVEDLVQHGGEPKKPELPVALHEPQHEHPVEEKHTVAAAAAGETAQLTSFSDPVPPATFSAAASLSATLTPTMSTSAVVPEMHAAAVQEPAPVAVEAKSSVAFKPSDDPVLAELERAETEAKAKPEPPAKLEPSVRPEPSAAPEPPLFSSYTESQGKRGKRKAESSRDQAGQDKAEKKTSGALIAVLVLVMLCAGLYAAWMYVPEFQTFAQPQVDRVLALAGIARTVQPAAPVRPRPAAPPTNAPASAGNSSAGVATTDSTTSGSAPAPVGATPSATAPSAGSTTVVPASASPSSPNASAGPSANASGAAQVGKAGVNSDGSKPGPDQNRANQSTAENKNVSGVNPSDAELPGEKTALILSSKGADKRLVHSVQPTFPAGAHLTGTEGTMVLKAVIDEDGKVAGARMIEGNAELAKAAVSAVKQWRYRPYVRDGKALPFQTIVLVDFQQR